MNYILKYTTFVERALVEIGGMFNICCNFTRLSAGYRSNHLERKVRTAKSNTPVNGRLPILWERESATENNCLELSG